MGNAGFEVTSLFTGESHVAWASHFHKTFTCKSPPASPLTPIGKWTYQPEPAVCWRTAYHQCNCLPPSAVSTRTEAGRLFMESYNECDGGRVFSSSAKGICLQPSLHKLQNGSCSCFNRSFMSGLFSSLVGVLRDYVLFREIQSRV